MPDSVVSFVVPAKDEEDRLPAALESIRGQRTAREFEVVVVDGDSDDATAEVARRYDAAVVEQRRTVEQRRRADRGHAADAAAPDGGASLTSSVNGLTSSVNCPTPSVDGDGATPGIGDARHRGAERAEGDWLAFVDADTVVRQDYLDAMLGFVREEGLAAASSRCRIVGPARAVVMQAVINRAFPRLGRPVLPGFNCFVRRDAYFAAGGFPDVPNEDTAFSRELGREWPTGYHPEVLVATSGRRVAESGLTGTLYHYLWLDRRRIGADY